jgi:methylglyoxal synthase
LRATPKSFGDMTIALIAHDEMKARMIEFAVDHEAELVKFHTILATGTTGREVAAATSRKLDDKMIRYHSGPKGGDIEIATMILHDLCDVVIFFVDPLRPHPHIEDIRVVFQACMVSDHVVMITNEMHAREFMARVVRGKEFLTLYDTL